jgi:phage shock protein PspC (stress-responsive transcriptional regulator)
VPPAALPARPQLVRRSDDRLLLGVAASLARWLGVDPIAVRIAFAVLAAAGGAGVVMYAAGVLLIPEEHPSTARRDVGLTVVAVAVSVLALQVVDATGLTLFSSVGAPSLLAGAGLAILWYRARRDRPDERPLPFRDVAARAVGAGGTGGATADEVRLTLVTRVVIGGLLVAVGVGTFVAKGDDVAAAGRTIVSVTVLLLGGLLLAGPWLWRLAGELATERRQRIRSEERAELAAHLHDSVLQTLTLIQRHPDRAEEVARLARRQERELRSWLSDPDGRPLGGTLTTALRSAADDVEDRHGVTVESVFVGERPLDGRLRAVVEAAAEAMRNAAAHSGAATVSLFAEADGHGVEVFVRDRGRGFDLDHLPPDRRGVAESIIGRMERAGGTASVRTRPGAGTEVALALDAPAPDGDG